VHKTAANAAQLTKCIFASCLLLIQVQLQFQEQLASTQNLLLLTKNCISS